MEDFKFSCKPSPKDSRDFQYKSMVEVPSTLQPKLSLKKYAGPVRNQGNYGTCTGFGCCATKDTQEAVAGINVVTSPLHLYINEKKEDGISEEGSYIRCGMKVLQQRGVCLEATMPYYGMSWPNLPSISQKAATEGLIYRIGPYASISSIYEIKTALQAKKSPVVIGVHFYESFRRPISGGYLPMPGEQFSPDPDLGGHCMAIVGYDDTKIRGRFSGHFEVKNSHGENWGDGGYCWMPYEFLSNGICYEAWSSIDMNLPISSSSCIELWIGRNYAFVNGVKVELDQSAIIAGGRTMVPVRFIAEQFGKDVIWDGVSKITIRDK